MSFNFEQMAASKQALRRRLAALPIVEKLRLLDAMRERALAIRNAGVEKPAVIQEAPPPYAPETSDE